MLHRTLPRPPAPPTLLWPPPGTVARVLRGQCAEAGGHVAAGLGSHGDPGDNTQYTRGYKLGPPRLHTSPVSGDTQMSELTVLIKLRSKANESNLLSCDAMINDVYNIVCSVPEESCIGNKAVSLAL